MSERRCSLRWASRAAAVLCAALALNSAALPGSLPAATQDTIELRNVPKDDVVMLLDGYWQRRFFNACVSDRVIALPSGAFPASITGSVSVPVGNFIPTASRWGNLRAYCPAEIAVFVHNRAMLLDVHPGWTTASDHVVEVLVPPLSVGLNVWVPTGNGTAATFAQAEVLLASSVFEKNRSGLKLVATVNVAGASFMGTSNGCADIPTIKAAGLYQADRLNVYFVDIILHPSGLSTDFGRNCFLDGAPNIIFVAVADHIPLTLAHEVGHAFLLLHTNIGYPDSYPGFESTNIMYDAADATTAEARHYVSLGQVYRLNVHKPSWLNSPVDGASSLRKGPTKTCQPIDSSTKVPCPWGPLAWP